MMKSKQTIIDELVKFVEKGKKRSEVLSKTVDKWQLNVRTFDRYWKIANNQHEVRQQLAKDAANRVYIASVEKAAEEAVMSELEAKKITTEIARSNLADYMVIRTVEFTPRIRISLVEYILRLENEFRFEQDFVIVADYNEDELEEHHKRQNARKRNIIRKQLELSKNPTATVIIDGDTELREVAELDLVKLIADKEKGKIKSFAHTQHGVKVEMYNADQATTTILKLHGSFPPSKIAQTDTAGNDVTPPTVIMWGGKTNKL